MRLLHLHLQIHGGFWRCRFRFHRCEGSDRWATIGYMHIMLAKTAVGDTRNPVIELGRL
jgi:hypothetical protein